MSIIQTFYDTVATNTRKTTGSATGNDTVVTVGQIACVIRPVDEKSQLMVESNFGKEFDMYCDDTEDVLVGDDISADKEYDVRGVNKYTDLEDDTESYLKIRLVAKR